MPRQNIPTDTRGRANFLGTVEARRIIKETVSVYRNLKKKTKNKKQNKKKNHRACDRALLLTPGTSFINSNVTLKLNLVT